MARIIGTGIALMCIALLVPATSAQAAECEDCGGGGAVYWVNTCTAGTDVIADHSLLVGLEITGQPVVNLIMGPCSFPENTLNIDRSAPAGGQINTEITSMCLVGGGVTIRAGAGIWAGGYTINATEGAIVQCSGDPEWAFSFFDVYFEVDFGDGTYGYNVDPMTIEEHINCIEPTRVYLKPEGNITLYDTPTGGTEVGTLVTADHGVHAKVHLPQPPDPTGWDVKVSHRAGEDPLAWKVLADDFECLEYGEIETICFWGSWKGDIIGTISNIHLSLHSDIPGPPYSQPGALRWSADFWPGDWTVEEELEDVGTQGWYDPNPGGDVIPNDHTRYFKYCMDTADGHDPDPPSSHAYQEYGLNWLDIQVTTNGLGEFGWKTSTEQNHDDAVWGDGPPPHMGPWNELIDPVNSNSLDLAFEIDPQEDVGPGPCVREAIPTVSEWGLIGLAVLLCACGATIFARRRKAAGA